MSTHVEQRDRNGGTGPGQTSPVDVDATLIYYARLRPATNNQVSNSTRNANESPPPPIQQPTAQAKRFFPATRERAKIWGSICDGCRLKLSAKWGQAANFGGRSTHTKTKLAGIASLSYIFCYSYCTGKNYLYRWGSLNSDSTDSYSLDILPLLSLKYLKI